MKLDIHDRLRLNEILDGNSMVSSIRLDLQAAQARVVLKFLPDAVSKADQHCRILQFTDLRRVSIFTYEEELPQELSNIDAPSAGFMQFASVLFDDQQIRQWDCFASASFFNEQPTWDYSLNEELEETTCAAFFKERGFEFGRSRPWAMPLWFGELSVDRPMGDPCSVTEFIEEYSFLLEQD
jgi:hypothetical protein